jgi:predicted acetyltransferase
MSTYATSSAAVSSPSARPATDRGAVRLVPLGEDRREELLDLDQWAFAFDDATTDLSTGLLGFEWDRTVGAEVDGELAGVHSVFSLDMPVPGGEVPTAGLTWVGVHPQHRRRGVLTAMARHHLQTVHERGREPVSALWAAEPAIYGRYGYGLGTFGLRMTLPRRAALVDVPGADDLRVTFAKVDPDRHVDVVQRVFDAVRAGRPGMVSRRGGLARKMLSDPPHWRGGAESLRLLLVTDDAGDPRAYALFRRKEKWEDGGPDGDVLVREAQAVDAAAARALWGRLTDLDLMGRVRTDVRPTDDALLHLLVDVRAVQPQMSDALWVRLVDVGAALAARTYSRDVDVVLEVADATCGWNARRWRLAAGPDGATCAPTGDRADLALDVRALGSAYLGGQTLTALAGAGAVEELAPGALPAAAAAFASPVAPYCGWVF